MSERTETFNTGQIINEGSSYTFVVSAKNGITEADETLGTATFILHIAGTDTIVNSRDGTSNSGLTVSGNEATLVLTEADNTIAGDAASGYENRRALISLSPSGSSAQQNYAILYDIEKSPISA